MTAYTSSGNKHKHPIAKLFKQKTPLYLGLKRNLNQNRTNKLNMIKEILDVITDTELYDTAIDKSLDEFICAPNNT